jgi:ParB-like chromosome segregation protein Spo0J
MKDSLESIEKISPSLSGLVVPIDGLATDPKNARLHTKRSLDAIRGSLAQFGQLKPIVVRDGVVVAGNGTLMAARDLGWRRIAAVDANELTAEQARAYGIMDNRSAELSEWDFSNLEDAFRGIDKDLLEFTGFDDDEVREALDLGRRPFAVVRVPIEELRPHPRNYQQHPPDQLAHIAKSIELNGFYRNVIVARDGTVLAGHGIVAAARSMGRKSVPVVRLNLDPDEPRALKVMASDNEIGNLAETDDRALTELLKGLLSTDGLEGSGFDERQLAALAMVTRTSAEIADLREAEEWVGMPSFEKGEKPFDRMLVSFASAEDRADFFAKLGVPAPDKARYMWWPPRPMSKFVGVMEFKEEAPHEQDPAPIPHLRPVEGAGRQVPDGELPRG